MTSFGSSFLEDEYVGSGNVSPSRLIGPEHFQSQPCAASTLVDWSADVLTERGLHQGSFGEGRCQGEDESFTDVDVGCARLQTDIAFLMDM